MGGSGLIYVAIVGAWAAYLVPRALPHPEEWLSLRPADARAGPSRVLTRRTRLDGRDARRSSRGRRDSRGRRRDRRESQYSLLRLRPAVRPDPVVKKRRVRPAGTAQTLAYGPPYPAAARAAHPPAPRLSAATLARRRRALGLLALASGIGAVAGAAGRVPLWAGGLPVLLLLTYLVELRAQERRRRAIGRRQRRSEAVANVRRRRVDLAARLEKGRRAGSVRAGAAPERSEWEEPESLAEDPPIEVHDGWRPVAVPLPTYVTAPRAPVPARTIDVSADGSWTAAGDTASDDTAEIPLVTASVVAPEAKEEGSGVPGQPVQPVQRRAVND